MRAFTCRKWWGGGEGYTIIIIKARDEDEARSKVPDWTPIIYSPIVELERDVSEFDVETPGEL